MESALVYLQARIAAAQRGRDSPSEAYPYVKEKLADAQGMLAELGMYELVRAAVEQSELLVQSNRLVEAEDLISDTARTLMERSGTHKDLERLYKPKSSQSNGPN